MVEKKKKVENFVGKRVSVPLSYVRKFGIVGGILIWEVELVGDI